MKVRYLFILFSLCLPSVGLAMDMVDAREAADYSSEKHLAKTSLQSSQKSLIVLLTKEDACKIGQLLDDPMHSNYEKNILFYKHCLFVIANKKADYSAQEITKRLNAGSYQDPVYKNLDNLLLIDRSHQTFDRLLSYLALFKYDWSSRLRHHALHSLPYQDAVLMWTIELRYGLSEIAHSEMCIVLRKLSAFMAHSPSSEDEHRQVTHTQNRLREIGSSKVTADNRNDELRMRLQDLVVSLSDQKIKYCIFMLTMPFLENRLSAYSFFLKLYCTEGKAIAGKNDPALVRMLVELLHEQLMGKQDELYSYLAAQKVSDFVAVELRDKLSAFIKALHCKRSHNVEEPEALSKKAKKEPMPRLSLDDFIGMNDSAFSEKLEELVKNPALLPNLQELMFHCTQRLHDEEKMSPPLVSQQAAYAQKVAALAQERAQLQAHIAGVRQTYLGLRADLEKQRINSENQLKRLTELSERTLVSERKDTYNV